MEGSYKKENQGWLFKMSLFKNIHCSEKIFYKRKSHLDMEKNSPFLTFDKDLTLCIVTKSRFMFEHNTQETGDRDERTKN